MLAGNFKQEITDKENPKDQSELLASDGQLFVHRQRGKPNVDAVEEGNDVKKKNERNDPNLHLRMVFVSIEIEVLARPGESSS
jgi:hypothetical protein